MKKTIKTYIDPVSGKEPTSINVDNILAVYCSTSFSNDFLKLIKITILQKGNVETTYHEGVDSSELNNTLRYLLEDLGEKFICAPKAPILINALECDIEKSNFKTGHLKKDEIVLSFSDGTVTHLNQSEVSIKGFNSKNITKSLKDNYDLDYSSGSM